MANLVHVPPLHLSHRLVWSFLLSTSVSLFGLTPGFTPNFSRFDSASIAYAQDLLPKVDNYVKAVLQMEPLRIKALRDVRAEMGPQTPKNVCRQSDLPDTVQTICANFFNRSAQIIQLNGLSNWEFNQITEKVRMDSLYRQRLNELLLEQTQ